MSGGLRERLLDDGLMRRLRLVADVEPGKELWEFASERARTALGRAEILLTGWGCPPLTAEVLAHAPRVRAVVHAAGSVKHHITPACWERGLAVTSAASANAVPVAEYTVAMIVLANKRVFRAAATYGSDPDTSPEPLGPEGNYGRRVGIVGASAIGRLVLRMLRPYALDLVVSDPYLDEAGARELGGRLLSLDELVATSDVVSLHAPSLPETRHMIDARRLATMLPGATLINTARGDLVDTDALTGAVLGGRLHAILDVTSPEPLPSDSPLRGHPHVLLTPHVAGSRGTELLRMGELAVSEVERLATGAPPRHAVRRETLARTA
ncbi:hydroxyacid dehydrogenase [Streptomyces sp. NBC_01003]|uniref:hydroxyacid dehydrogenase n=1 Tax=Streptomyces sp. NBC_01003 TaxID=2903714 RepID=UPI00386DDBFD|nr:hydroxyacid dehydrogenase [Streptomyces sp. NBC_01003]